MTEQTTLPGGENVPERRAALPLGRTLAWLGVAGASAALTFFLVRASMRRAPVSDETTQRIQDLIDEANRLMKTLDEKRHA